jgi:hypothetical protein
MVEEDQFHERMKEVNLKYELALILLVIAIALRIISLAGYMLMGSIGIISLPSFVVSHEFLLSAIGFAVFIGGFILCIVSYYTTRSNTMKAALIVLIAAFLPPVDIFMLLAGILLIVSRSRS